MELELQTRLSDLVISEVDLSKLLNVTKSTIDNLRYNKSLPYCRLTARDRVYLIDDVVGWLKKQSVSKIEAIDKDE